MPALSAPFSLGDGPDACLLLHGLTGAPSEVRPVGEALARAGFHAVGPLLPGHGTRPEDLDQVTRSDLFEAARAALLGLRGARRIYLCGLSAGALLSLELAARGFAREGLPPISRLALLAPAIDFAGLTWVFTSILGRLPALSFILKKGGREVQAQAALGAQAASGDPSNPDGSYRGVPLRWGRELRLLSAEALAIAPSVRTPALILHGARDRTAAPSGARRLARVLAGPVTLRMFARSGHVLPLDVEGAEVCAAVVSFFRGS